MYVGISVPFLCNSDLGIMEKVASRFLFSNFTYENILEGSTEVPLINSWFLMSSIWPISSIVAFYLYFVLKLGPQWMENRKPIDLKYVLILYNAIQVVYSIGLCWAVVKVVLELESRKSGMSWKYICAPLPRHHDDDVMYLVYSSGWYYFFAKVVELLDTVFFVLRKKNNQITALHVYHHSIMAFSTWGYLKYVQGEQGLFIGFMNSAVHVMMYFYYLVAALGPQFQKYIWWKKYMTKIQLGQFIIMLIYLVGLLVFGCKQNRILTYYMCFNVTAFLLLFLNFYRKAYIHNNQLKQKSS
ncbi:hypothetical protein M8J77_017669 [Diaphorina citri]|nr:hypothetical protein M8J77_017669 [Diaphorina citri]